MEIKAPETLKELRKWIVWRYEERPGDPKPAKVPYSPMAKHIKKEAWRPVKNEKGFIEPEYSGSALSNKSNTWGTYEAALKCLDRGIFQGLGIMLHDGLCGIDIDGCVCDRQLIGPAKGILDIMDTYAEYSPSGTGIHLLFFGQVKEDKSLYKKNPKNGVEIYSKGRYFTFTGKTINDKDVEERTIQIEKVQMEYMQKKVKREAAAGKTTMDISDSELIKIAYRSKNGQAFQRLWLGDISGYNSQSEADLSLCNMLSFYTQADAGRIDNLFRQSGLYREKWEREDYRYDTIKTAIDSTRETYDPEYNKKKSQREASAFKDDGSPDKNEKFFLVPRNINKPESGLKVDVSLLTMYMKQKYNIRYYKNQFRVFKNDYYSYVEDMKRVISNEIPEEYRVPKNITDCEALLTMDPDIVLHDRDLAHERYISFRNGVLNIENMEFRPHADPVTKKLIFLNLVGYDYNPDVARCKYVDDFFISATNGKPEDINFLYQILGVAISGYRDFKNIFFLSGKKDCGKSVFLRIMELLLTNSDGTTDYSSIGLRTLTDETSKEYVGIIAKRANIVGETPPLKITDDTLLKKLSGGDTISAPTKFREAVEFKNKAMLIFAGNTVPSFFLAGSKSAIAERMIIYQFKNVIPKESQIKKLEEKMNIQYVIKKSIEQLKVFIRNNQEFIAPQEVVENREVMLMDSDTIFEFYKKSIIVTDDEKDRISSVDLYEEFVNFMVEEGHLRIDDFGKPDLSRFKISKNTFTRRIKEYHGEGYYKRKLTYKNTKADVFTNMVLNNNIESFNPVSEEECKTIAGYFS